MNTTETRRANTFNHFNSGIDPTDCETYVHANILPAMERNSERERRLRIGKRWEIVAGLTLMALVLGWIWEMCRW